MFIIYRTRLRHSPPARAFDSVQYIWYRTVAPLQCNITRISHGSPVRYTDKQRVYITYIYREKAFVKQNNHNFGWLLTERCDKERGMSGQTDQKHTHTNRLETLQQLYTKERAKFW